MTLWRNMPWKHTVDLSEEWDKFDNLEVNDDDGKVFLEARTAIVKKMREHPLYSDLEHPTFTSYVDTLEKQECLEDFNDMWDNLYDYCDLHRIWLQTTF